MNISVRELKEILSTIPDVDSDGNDVAVSLSLKKWVSYRLTSTRLSHHDTILVLEAIPSKK